MAIRTIGTPGSLQFSATGRPRRFRVGPAWPPTRIQSAIFSAVARFVAAGGVEIGAAATFSAVAEYLADTYKVGKADATLTAEAALAAIGTKIGAAASPFSAEAAFVAAANKTGYGAAPMSAEAAFVAAGDYWANAVNFDGTNDYLNRGGDLTGSADSKSGTLAFRIRNLTDGALDIVFANLTAVGGNVARFTVQKTAADAIRILSRNAAGTDILDINSGNDSVEVADGYRTILASWNLANAAQRHLYIGDTSALTVVTYTDDTIDYTTPQWIIGAVDTPANFLHADVADLLFWQGVYRDFSVEANRRDFISAAGKLVNPAVAVAALGTPIIGMVGPTSTWQNNLLGSGGAFTENGALTDGTSPSA